MTHSLSSPQNNSISPSDSLRTTNEKHRSSSDYSLDSKKRKVEDKDSMSRYVSSLTWCCNIISFMLMLTASLLCFQDSDGDKSDDLVVDVSNEVRCVNIIQGSLKVCKSARTISRPWKVFQINRERSIESA